MKGKINSLVTQGVLTKESEKIRDSIVESLVECV